MDQDRNSLCSINSNEYVVVTSSDPKLKKIDDMQAKLEEALDETTNISKNDQTLTLDETCSPSKIEPSTKKPTTLASLGTLHNSVLFYGVKYLGCASVNAPKSETEITRIMHTLNQEGGSSALVEVIMSVPNNVEDSIQLFDAQSEIEISTYKMSQVLFVVRGTKGTSNENCFAFTTCHGDQPDHLIFPCHVFRASLSDAISKILYSFWTVFKRQQMINQKKNSNEIGSINETNTSTQSSNQQTTSSIASSLFNSIYGAVNQQSNNDALAEQALKISNCLPENQFIFRTTIEIKEHKDEELLKPGQNDSSNFISVPKDKEFFKLRKNFDKNILIQVQQISNKPLEIQRCFGVLLSAGRNCSVGDMQLLTTLSMGKCTNGNGYQISAYWNPREPSFAILNEETQKNMRIFLTIAIDVVIDGIQEPVRFCIETKAKIYSPQEKFWVYQRTKLYEDFYIQLKPMGADRPAQSSLADYHLESILSQTELVRKQNQKPALQASQMDDSDEALDGESDMVFSGMGSVNKDMDETELLDWAELMRNWRGTSDRPKGLKQLVCLKGIPDTLRGEVWQLLANCVHDEKYMHESYRLLLSKESPCEQVILRDINRTFPGHQFFQDENGQQALYKLSKAYSVYDQEIGYCQGLSFLIATLLLHMPEEQAFNLLVKIMFNYQLREIYKTNFENLHTRFYQLDMLIQELLPDLHDHFSDLNIEIHMFASQWFLTLYTAKFPLHMVFRIMDLFLHDGINVLFSIGIALLKQSQKDLLSLDFEGVLKYFRVNLPKKYRNESSLKDLIQVWLQIRGKITDKKLKKYEKMYLTQKELDALREDPLVRLEKQNKHLTNTVRRLELENDDLANEFIDSRMSLSKQLDEQRDLNEQLKLDLAKFKRDSHLLVNEQEDTIKKYSKELEALKSLWRNQSEKYEHEIERQQVIINEYKQICNKLSTKIEANSTCKILFEQFFMKFKSIKLCDDCNEKYANDLELNKLISTIIDLINDTNDVPSSGEQSIQSISNSVSSNSIATNDHNSQTQSLDKIKQLELELARVKLELVDAQCKNQEYKHKFKQIQLQQADTQETFKVPLPPNSLASSMSSLTSPGVKSNGNSWLTKTFSQFKEATNQVVQKVKNQDNN